ncbi:hypothetical protein BDZ94DRAFT_1255863 [Collybia nuda]|uniref:Uncharacterized protein n=1 Tax=Collybia nuda TaxID=64659 RepID=A0A9P5YBF0_9AGAR|nr:hypothetical protein BDZ94DRAFT_1255863 [Collybia nuda]
MGLQPHRTNCLLFFLPWLLTESTEFTGFLVLSKLAYMPRYLHFSCLALKILIFPRLRPMLFELLTLVSVR